MGDCGFCAYIPRERVMAVCEWALAKVGEMRREKDRAFLREQARRRNCRRRLVRMRPLSGDEVHRRLMQETDSLGFSRHDYPWRCWREREFKELLTLARDASGGVRVSGRDWHDMLQWCEGNGWRDKEHRLFETAGDPRLDTDPDMACE